MNIRILELADRLEIDTCEILATCTLYKIPATSRISCLNKTQALKIINHYKMKRQKSRN